MIYLLTAIGMSPGGSSTVHIYTQTIHRTTQITTDFNIIPPPNLNTLLPLVRQVVNFSAQIL